MPGRVHSHRQFVRLTSPTGRGRSGSIRVHFVASNELSEEFLVAFAIGRAVGNAVERNTIRRRLRSLMDEIQPHCGQGLYLIKCGFATKELTYDQLREQLRSALRSAGCYQ